MFNQGGENMLDGIMMKLGFGKTKVQPLGEASRVKKDFEVSSKTQDKLVRSPKKDTFTSSSSVKEQVKTENK